MNRKITTVHIEEALFRHFNVRRNIIVPNVYWGLGFYHELDMLVCYPSGYCTEVEIKVSKTDILADKKKKHGHNDERIRYLYFAVPESLKEYALEHIPKNAGLLILKEWDDGATFVEEVRKAKARKNAIPLTEEERIQLMRLGCMRLHRWAKDKIKCLEAQR